MTVSTVIDPIHGDKIMFHEAMFRQFLVFRTRTSIIGIRINGNPAAWQEFSPDFDVFRS